MKWARDGAMKDDKDCHEDGTSDSSAGDKGNAYFKRSLVKGHHYLHPSHGAVTVPAASTAEKHDDFHYQHHRVSAYHRSHGDLSGRLPRSDGVVAPKHGRDVDGDEAGGMFARALGYFAWQRERWHRLELERQVEDQRRRLAGMARRRHSAADEADRGRRAGGDDAAVRRHGARPSEAAANGASVGLDDQPGVEETGESCLPPVQGNVVSGMSDICGFGRSYSNRSDDSSDGSGVTR